MGSLLVLGEEDLTNRELRGRTPPWQWLQRPAGPCHSKRAPHVNLNYRHLLAQVIVDLIVDPHFGLHQHLLSSRSHANLFDAKFVTSRGRASRMFWKRVL